MIGSKSILKSTALIGGSSIVSIFTSIIRSKVIALLLGPSGTGLIGAFQSSISLIQVLSSLGIDNSAVRDIADANSKGNENQLSFVVKVVRKIVFFTGSLGVILTICFARDLSKFTFHSDAYTSEIRLLSIAVFMNLMQAGYAALIQGMRLVKDFAKMSIFSGLFATVFSLPLIFILRFDGIIYYLIVVAFGQFLVTFYYSRKIKIRDVKIGWRLAIKKSISLIKLGFSFMGGALVGVIATYLIKVLIITELGLVEAGIYQAAFTLSGLYIGIILEAMGKDFYPRLTAVAYESKKEIQLINDQIKVGMMLSAPGLMFTLAGAPLAIRLLYSADYSEAYPVLQWMILGVFLRTISWPMGFLLVARAKGEKFLISQILSNVILLFSSYYFIISFGIEGAGIAFFSLYIFHVAFMYFFIRTESDFRWTNDVINRLIFLSIAFGASFVAIQYMPFFWSTVTSLTIGFVLSIFALKEIFNILEINSVKELIELVYKSRRSDK